MKEVWVIADAVVSPLGEGSEKNFTALKNGQTGVSFLDDPELSPVPIHAGKINALSKKRDCSRFEELCIRAINPITVKFKPDPARTLFILSTTKGNIRFLEDGQADHERVHLPATASFLAQHFGFSKNLVISNACISGVMAITVAKRFLQSGQYDHALIVGADELSRFVVSGFQSLHALSDEPCKPFDSSRKGINLGEAAAAILLSVDPPLPGISPQIKVLGSGLSNDANHISGPSRTGEELNSAIASALKASKLSPEAIDFISAHGTATPYNDEMEAKAFNLAGLGKVPLNSLKGYYGHTLGAAGVLEIIISIHSLLNDTLIPTFGFGQSGTSQPVEVIRKAGYRPLKTFLKTASGFGGCNAAIVFQKK
jgi:3-oxoacyl-[acyl-carrier-protein] synthase-1